MTDWVLLGTGLGLSTSDWIAIISLIISTGVCVIGAGLLRWMFKIHEDMATVKADIKTIVGQGAGVSNNNDKIWTKIDDHGERITRLETGGTCPT